MYFSPATNYPAAQWQQKAARRRRSGGTGGGAANVLGTKGFSVSKSRAPRWELCACAAARCFSGLWFHQTEPYCRRVRRGLPTSLGDLLLPNDRQAVSCYCWSAFCLQANVTVVPELIPYWRLILGEREKSGQYGSH